MCDLTDAEKKQRFNEMTREMEDNENRVTKVVLEIKALEQEKARLQNLNHGLHEKRGLYCTEHAYDGLRMISMNKSSPCKYCGNTDYEGPSQDN